MHLRHAQHYTSLGELKHQIEKHENLNLAYYYLFRDNTNLLDIFNKYSVKEILEMTIETRRLFEELEFYHVPVVTLHNFVVYVNIDDSYKMYRSSVRAWNRWDVRNFKDFLMREGFIK